VKGRLVSSSRRRRKLLSSSSSRNSYKVIHLTQSNNYNVNTQDDDDDNDTNNDSENKNTWNNNDQYNKLPSISRVTSGAWYQRDEMKRHDILTKSEEFTLGNQIMKALKLQDEILVLLEQKNANSNNNTLGKKRYSSSSFSSITTNNNSLLSKSNNKNVLISNRDSALIDSEIYNLDIHPALKKEPNNDDLDDFTSIYGAATSATESSSSSSSANNIISTNNYPNNKNKETEKYSEKMGAKMANNNLSTFLSSSSSSLDKRIDSALVQEGSKLSISSIEMYIKALTEEDINHHLKLEGGHVELHRILLDGAEARNKLMRYNIRLVVSIAKKWFGRSFAAGNAEGATLQSLYLGGWDRPSLDEAVQEGILGLARAVDKFDPNRGLRFSTYSTHWITSYIRQCFQSSSTTCLKVPSQLHEIKASYRSILKRELELSMNIPTEEMVAEELGITVTRLRTAIRVTEPLVSIDQPVSSGGSANYKGSGAGGDYSGDNSLLISDSLKCSETAPEEVVEISFLRQSLENAMASELSPHERDVLRLRLGLDDGQTRTAREVVNECGGGISLADVRAAERRAFKKLRSPNSLHAHNLLQYLEMAGIH